MLVEQITEWVWGALGGTRNEVLYTLLVFVGVLLAVRCIQWLKFQRSLPPGPWGVPIFGYLPFIRNDAHVHFREMAKKYGPMISVRIGSELIVVMSNYHIIRETFRREDFSGRPHTEFIKILGGYGIINTEGALWKDQKKFVHDKLKKFGMTFLSNKNEKLRATITREIDCLVGRMTMQRGKPTDLAPFLSVAISNVICSLIMGLRFNHGDMRFARFMHLIDEGFKLFGSLMTVNYIPVLRHLPSLRKILNKITQNREEMSEFFQQNIDEHKATFDRNHIRDIVDAYLLEIEKAQKEGRVLFEGKDHNRQLQQILGDLFSAGMETVKNTLQWAVVLMLHHPEAAKAVQDELDQVVGRSKMPTMDDLKFLPLTEATIQEILRISSVVPLGTTHATTRDVVVNGYNIPAGTEVMPSLYAVHKDPEIWDEPEVFRPSRFIDSEGKCFKPEYFMPFGVGRRMCLGEVLARMELFLFFSSLMHTFDLKAPEGVPLPSLIGIPGTTLTPQPFEVCMLPREINLCNCDSNEVTTNGPLRNIGSH